MGLKEFALDRERRVGREEGREEGVSQTTYQKDFAFVKSLLNETDFDNDKISRIVGVSVEFVENVQKQIKS